MSWSTPLTAVSNTALTAAQWNASVRDNLLETGPAKVSAAGQILVATGANALAARVPSTASVATSQTSANTGYVDLATAGPAVTVTTGAAALVSVGAMASNDTTGARTLAAVAVSGATTVAADDSVALAADESGAGRVVAASRLVMLTGLTPGSNTFTMKYKVSGGTGTWVNRQIVVIPL